MKNLILFIAVLFAFSTVTVAQEIEFQSETIDYGTIAQNADGVREFIFTNTGDAPLLITDAKGSCGCTVPTYPKEPIAPGATAKINVKYDTKRIGHFTKTVTVTSNAKTNTMKVLKITGEILPPVAGQPAATPAPQGHGHEGHDHPHPHN